MLQSLVSLIIILLIAGFVFFAVRKALTLVPVEPIFAQAIDVILVIVVVGIILFWVVIPLLNMLAGAHLAMPTIK